MTAKVYKGVNVFYQIKYSLVGRIGARRPKRRRALIMDSCGNSVGRIYLVRDKGLFKQEYCIVELSGTRCYVYMVGLGKQGDKSPIYCNESQIAEVDKGCIVHDNLDEYEMYAINENAMTIALLFSVYWDLLRYRNSGEFTYKKVSVRYNYTLDRAYKEKYTPDFVRRIRLEDASYLRRP